MTTAIRTKIVAATLLAGFGCAPAEDSTDRTEAGAAVAVEEMAAEARSSGVEGLVTLTPPCPVVEEGQGCPTIPYETTVVIRDAESGEMIVTTASDAEGKFHVELAPGDYVLEGGTSRVETTPKAEPVAFTVVAGGYTSVEMKYDSGIR